MRRFLLTAQFLFLLSFCNSQVQFTINGTVKNIKPEKVFIEYNSIGVYKTDSDFISNGKFKFNGTIDGPTPTRIYFKYQGIPKVKHYSSVFLEKGVTEIVQDSNSVAVKGFKAQELYRTYQKKFEPFNGEWARIDKEYYKIYSQKDTTGMERITLEKENIDKIIRAIYREEFLRDPTSPLAVYLLDAYTYAGYERDGLDIDTLFAKIPKSAKSTSAGILLEKKLSPLILCRVGNIAPEFTQNDTTGAPVSLSSFKGNYVLIDFWASWCGPCRKENPFYVSAFKKYNEKGFQILSVSLDEEKIAWLKAIRKDNLNWTHVSDLKFFQNAVAVQYGIKGIPRNFLIDPSGKIIAKDLRGEELEKMLGQVFPD